MFLETSDSDLVTLAAEEGLRDELTRGKIMFIERLRKRFDLAKKEGPGQTEEGENDLVK